MNIPDDLIHYLSHRNVLVTGTIEALEQSGERWSVLGDASVGRISRGYCHARGHARIGTVDRCARVRARDYVRIGYLTNGTVCLWNHARLDIAGEYGCVYAHDCSSVGEVLGGHIEVCDRARVDRILGGTVHLNGCVRVGRLEAGTQAIATGRTTTIGTLRGHIVVCTGAHVRVRRAQIGAMLALASHGEIVIDQVPGTARVVVHGDKASVHHDESTGRWHFEMRGALRDEVHITVVAAQAKHGVWP